MAGLLLPPNELKLTSWGRAMCPHRVSPKQKEMFLRHRQKTPKHCLVCCWGPRHAVACTEAVPGAWWKSTVVAPAHSSESSYFLAPSFPTGAPEFLHSLGSPADMPAVLATQPKPSDGLGNLQLGEMWGQHKFSLCLNPSLTAGCRRTSGMRPSVKSLEFQDSLILLTCEPTNPYTAKGSTVSYLMQESEGIETLHWKSPQSREKPRKKVPSKASSAWEAYSHNVMMVATKQRGCLALCFTQGFPDLPPGTPN